MADVDDVDQSADTVAVQEFCGKLLFLQAREKDEFNSRSAQRTDSEIGFTLMNF